MYKLLRLMRLSVRQFICASSGDISMFAPGNFSKSIVKNLFPHF